MPACTPSLVPLFSTLAGWPSRSSTPARFYFYLIVGVTDERKAREFNLLRAAEQAAYPLDYLLPRRRTRRYWRAVGTLPNFFLPARYVR